MADTTSVLYKIGQAVKNNIPTGTLSTSNLGYTESGRNYPVELSGGKLYVNVPWVDTNTDTNTTYSTATSSVAGLVKIGYAESGKNYPVELNSSGQMYVNVPWTDTNTNTQLSTEQVQDIVGGMVSSNTETNISVTYNDSGGKLNFALSGVVLTTNNTSLNSDNRNTRGVTRLYRRDSNTDYSVQTYWTGSHWFLKGYSGDNLHAECRVGYADSAGNAGTLDSLDSTHFLNYNNLTNKPTIPSVSSSSQYILSASGNYGTVKVNDDRGVTWAGYAIRDDWVFMSDGAATCGIYNDTNNEWQLICRANAETELMYNGSMKLETTSAGVSVAGTLAATSLSGDGASVTNVDASLLGGLSSGNFLRSNTGDNVTGGYTRWYDNIELYLGTGADFMMYHSGTHTYLKNNNHTYGNIYIQGEDKRGSNHALVYCYTDNYNPFVRLYYDGNTRLTTTSDGITVGGEVTTSSGTVATKSHDNFDTFSRSTSSRTIGYWGSDNEYEMSWARTGDVITIFFLITFDNSGGISSGGYYSFTGLPYTPAAHVGRPTGTYARIHSNLMDPRLCTIQSGKLFLWGGSSGLPSRDENIEGSISYQI